MAQDMGHRTWGTGHLVQARGCLEGGAGWEDELVQAMWGASPYSGRAGDSTPVRDLKEKNRRITHTLGGIPEKGPVCPCMKRRPGEG